MGQQEQTRTDMLPENILNMKMLCGFIAQANSLLSLSEREIWQKYRQYPVCFMDLRENEERQKSVEIRFDNEQTSITCLFNQEGICDYAFITPDRINPIAEYVNFFNAIFEYDSFRCRWVMAHGYLSQKKINTGLLFMVNC
jgi:hypothetical protein